MIRFTPETMESSSVTSMANVVTPACSRALMRSTRRATAYTSKPALRSRIAAFSPMPLDPPVTSATRALLCCSGGWVMGSVWRVLHESTTDRLGDRAEPGPGDVRDGEQPRVAGVGPHPGGLGGVDAEAAAGAGVLGVLERHRVARRTAAGEEVEHHDVVGHRREDAADQPGGLGGLEDMADDRLELGDRGVGRADLLGQPDGAQLLAAPGVQPILLEDVDPIAVPAAHRAA